MTKGRLEAFSDGVIAILITIMVLELKVPQGTDWQALRPLLPVVLAYTLSFVFLGIYWNNHHHMFHRVSLSPARLCPAISTINMPNYILLPGGCQ